MRNARTWGTVGMALMLAACASIPVPGKELAVGCQVADAATTGYAWHIGAGETNPIIGKSLWRLLALKGLAIWAIWEYFDRMGDGGKVLVSAASCLPVAANIVVIDKQRAMNATAHRFRVPRGAASAP